MHSQPSKLPPALKMVTKSTTLNHRGLTMHWAKNLSTTTETCYLTTLDYTLPEVVTETEINGSKPTSQKTLLYQNNPLSLTAICQQARTPACPTGNLARTNTHFNLLTTRVAICLPLTNRGWITHT